MTGPDQRGVGAGAQTRWQHRVVSIAAGKSPQDILKAAERELIEAYRGGARHLLLLPKQNLLFFAQDQPGAATILAGLRESHPHDPLLLLRLDIYYYGDDRSPVEAAFDVLPPKSAHHEARPLVSFEIPRIGPELRESIRLAEFEIEDLFLLLAEVPKTERKYLLTRLASYLELHMEIPEPWEERDHLMALALRVPPRDRALFFIGLRALATMHGLSGLLKDLDGDPDAHVMERTVARVRKRSEWLLDDERRRELGDPGWIRKLTVALHVGLGRVFHDRIYSKELRERLLTAYIGHLSAQLGVEVPLSATIDILSGVMMQDNRKRLTATIETYWGSPGWENLERLVRAACRDLVPRRQWMERYFDDALREVPRHREAKRWRRISSLLLPRAFRSDEIPKLVEGLPVEEQGLLTDHVARVVDADLLSHIDPEKSSPLPPGEGAPGRVRAQLVQWISEIPPEQRLQAVRYLRTLVAGNFLDRAVNALKQSAFNGRTKALKTAVHLEAVHLLAQVTDEGAQWYGDAGAAIRRMAVFCPNCDSSEKLFEAILRSFGYEDLREEVPSLSRELLQILLTTESPEAALMNFLPRVHARPELHTVYSIACSFFSGLEELPEAMEKLRLLETTWAEVGKKGGGRGGAPSADGRRASARVVVEALSRAHAKGLTRTSKVLQAMATLALAGKISLGPLSGANLDRILRSKGLGSIAYKLGAIDGIVLFAATSVQGNEAESAVYLASLGLATGPSHSSTPPAMWFVPSHGVSGFRVVPTLP